MQRQKPIILLLILAVIMLLAQCQGCPSETDEYILKAIPADAGVIIETQKLPYIIHHISSENKVCKSLKDFKLFSKMLSLAAVCDSVLSSSNALYMAVSGKRSAISFHKFGRDKIRALVAINVNQQDGSKILKEIYGTLNGKCTISKRNYEKSIIFTLKNDDKDLFYYAYSKDLFVISNSEMLVETAVRQIHSSQYLADNSILSKLLGNKGKNVDANIIVNYKSFYDLLKSETAPIVSAKVEKIAKYSDWSVLDFSVMKDDIVVNGFTKNKDITDRFLNIFKDQEPIDNDFVDYLPGSTIYFASIGISNMQNFKECYVSYLKDRDKYTKYKSVCTDLRKNYGIDADEVYDIFSNRITEFTADYFLAGHGKDNYLIASVIDNRQAEQLLGRIVSKYQKKNNLKEGDVSVKVVTPMKKSYDVKKIPIKNLMAILFGDMFATADYQYYTMYKDNLIFGQNISAIKEYLSALENNKCLSGNSLFKEYCDHASPSSNIYYYFDVAYAHNIITTYLNNSNASDINNNKYKLKGIRNFCLQYSRYKDMYLSNLVLKYSDDVDADHRAVWIAPIDSTLQTKPFVTINHNTNDKEIALQSTTNKFYVLDKNGGVVIKKQIPEPIVGSVYQIDYYDNGKLQYFFATENHLYLIDRNGNIMDGFPVRLPAQITAPVSVFDYENNRNYRIFVPCADNKLYLFTKEGKMLDGWTPIETDQSIITPVQYFKLNDVEYLVFADKLKTYIVNRRGETRINMTGNFPKAKNTLYYLETMPSGRSRFITTNSSGQVEYIYMDGSRETKNLKNYTANHYFLLKDIDGNGSNEYIFADNNRLEAFDANGKLLFSKQFDGRITEDIMMFSFSPTDIKLGITCRDNQKIYMVDNSGNVSKGFPLIGTTKFSIAVINKKYCILTGGNDNFIYNYQMP